MKVSDITRRGDAVAARRQKLAAFLQTVNQTQTAYPRHQTVPRIFAEQVTRTPDATAVIYRSNRLSYRDLDGRSNQLARLLLDRDLKPEALVGVLLDRSPAAIVAILGALKAGGAYLPLGSELPGERIVQLLRDSGAPMLIAEHSQSEACRRILLDCPHLRHVLLVSGNECIDSIEILDSEGIAAPQLDLRESGPPVDRSQPGTLAYVMYTSGTTGVPKGVMIEHHAILRLVVNTNWIQLGPADRILQTGSMFFDASTFEIWGALLNGGALCIPDRHELLDPAALGRLIREHRITTLWLTAGLFNALAANHLDIFAGLHTVVCGGEKVSARHFNLVRKAHPGLTLKNGYGPTENTTFTTCYEVQQDFEKDVPIGGPIANTTAYILDDTLEPVDIGKPGELYTGGDGLARGYLNDPVLTAQKFIEHPTAGRLYRTGDLARWRPDGNIDCLGRIDDQVKIRGYRIEPAEVESQLLRHPHVKEAIVAAKPAREGGAYLVAYHTGRGTLDAGELRRYLQRSLPEYMIPSFFVQLDALPLTPNGKVDRAALPDPGQALADADDQGTPTSETERELLAIWQKVLDRTHIRVHNNFFEVGGHSLNAVRLTYLVHQRLGVVMPFTLIFKAPTIHELAGAIIDAARFGESAIDQPLVCLTRQRTGRPVFAFPPGTADALGYSQLASRLGSCVFYAFNFIESETRLERYADLITSVDPEGPYVLFGYSAGGNLAFRTAKELERSGKSVSDIIMLDSSRFLTPYRFPAHEARRLAQNFLNEDGVRTYAHSQVLRDKVMRTIERYYDFLSSTQDDGAVSANIHLITSAHSEDEYHDEGGRLVCSKSAWAQATRGRFRSEQGFGEHSYMLHTPHLDGNAALVREIVESSSAAERTHV